jgi:hypothetical protein
MRLTASLKRCPDTKQPFFGNRLSFAAALLLPQRVSPQPFFAGCEAALADPAVQVAF